MKETRRQIYELLESNRILDPSTPLDSEAALILGRLKDLTDDTVEVNKYKKEAKEAESELDEVQGELEDAEKEITRLKENEMTPGKLADFYQAIEHGDDEHRKWLRSEFEKFWKVKM